MDSKLNINLLISGKKIQVNIASINKRAKSEIENVLSARDVDVKDILKAYIQKCQEYAEMEDRLQDLIGKMER
ncbi:hypothetical protein [Helicobacter sp. 23-1045]